jgi:hypothetical protein
MASSLTRTSTPVPPSEGASAENTAADDALLWQFAAATVDIKTMHSQMITFFRDAISMMLPDTSGLDGSSHSSSSAEGSVLHVLSMNDTDFVVCDTPRCSTTPIVNIGLATFANVQPNHRYLNPAVLRRPPPRSLNIVTVQSNVK